MAELQNKRVAIVATDGVEDSEFNQPVEAIKKAGGEVVVISDIEEFEGKKGTEYRADKKVGDVNANDYDALFLPGGVANPDRMRMNPHAVNFIRDFFSQSKPVAAICHAPWLLIEAGVVNDRTLTSYPSLKTDLTNAGANYVDEEVVVDAGLVTSRKPDDLDAFCEKMVEEFAEGKHAEQVA